MKILVTGATIVGWRLLPFLLECGHNATAVGRNPDRLHELRAAGRGGTPGYRSTREGFKVVLASAVT